MHLLARTWHLYHILMVLELLPNIDDMLSGETIFDNFRIFEYQMAQWFDTVLGVIAPGELAINISLFIAVFICIHFKTKISFRNGDF